VVVAHRKAVAAHRKAAVAKSYPVVQNFHTLAWAVLHRNWVLAVLPLTEERHTHPVADQTDSEPVADQTDSELRSYSAPGHHMGLGPQNPTAVVAAELLLVEGLSGHCIR
jgi:hypothetical protein